MTLDKDAMLTPIKRTPLDLSADEVPCEGIPALQLSATKLAKTIKTE